MKVNTRFISILVCILFLFSLLTACGTTNSTKEADETQNTAADTTEAKSTAAAEQTDEWLSDTSPVTIDMYVDASWFSGDWKDTAAKRVTEKSGVTLNIIKPVTDDGQKFSLMIADKSLPDLICADRTSMQWELAIKSGQLYSLDELMDKYAPKMRDFLEPEVLENYRADDGKTYTLTTFVETNFAKEEMLKYNQLVQSNQNCILYRKDYYEEIGSPDMSTPEKFASALELMKQKHPDKIPFYMGALKGQGLSSFPSFFAYGLGSFSEVNGELKMYIRDQKIHDMLMFLNGLASKKLITKDAFIDTTEARQQKINNGDVIAFNWTLGESGKSPADNPNTKYEVLKPFETYKNVRYGKGWMATAISKNAKNPERCIKFLEFLLSPEGYECTNYGVKGEKFGDIANGPHYNIVDGKPQYLKEFWDTMLADMANVQKVCGLCVYWFVSQSPYNVYEMWFPQDPAFETYNEWFGPYVEYKPEYDMILPANSDESLISQKILDLVDEYKVKIIFAKSQETADAMYKELIEKCQNSNMEKLEQYYTQVWKKFMENKNK